MANTEAPLSDSRPILSFAPPDVSAIPKVEKHSVPPFVQRPPSGRQGERLAPQFAALSAAFEGRRLELSDTTPEDDPELVAVFDLAGAVDDFYKAASKVPGLEFLFDLEGDDVDPDDDFYFADNQGDAADKSVPQHLYMVMSNANALGELIRLFELWQADNSIKLSTGLNPLKEAFALIRRIRRWEAEDRIRETGLLEQWREDARDAGSQSMRAEIELWYRSDPDRQNVARLTVEQALAASNGRIIASSIIDDIRYHGLLIEIPRSSRERPRKRRDGDPSLNGRERDVRSPSYTAGLLRAGYRCRLSGAPRIWGSIRSSAGCTLGRSSTRKPRCSCRSPDH